MKIQMKNKMVDDYGIVILSDDAILEMLYNNKDINDVICNESESTIKYNSLHNKDILHSYTDPNMTISEFDDYFKSEWFMPQEYKDIDIEQYLIDKCKTDIEINRVANELILFKERDLYNLLRTMIWFVDVFIENKVVWGVGRGSSVASYCLYLIGIHKVDSLKYDLDIHEFLK